LLYDCQTGKETILIFDRKMANLTFDQLPEAVNQLLTTVSRIEHLLLEKQYSEDNQGELLNVKEASSFLNLSVSTIYTKVCRGEIPALKPGRRLYFDKNELVHWIKSCRKKSNEELAAEARTIVSRNQPPFQRKRKAYRKI